MPSPFLSSEEYDERAHELYNEGQYDEALAVLREGLTLYPHAVELHIGVGYARLAREEYAWARRSFEEALILEPDHEDGLAGLGEVLLKFGQQEAALRSFRRILELGYADDIDLVLQVGRALFREDRFAEAKEFFGTAVAQAPEMAEAVALQGYAEHRLGDDDAAIAALRKALRLDSDHAEARIYLANILYDRGEYEGSLYHFAETTADDHWDELGIYRLVELKKSLHAMADDDPWFQSWEQRLTELAGDPDSIDELLQDVVERVNGAADESRGQLELFGALLTDLAETRREDAHHVVIDGGREFNGTWEEIVADMRAAAGEPEASMEDFMTREARRWYSRTGVRIPTADAESFIRGSADAGLLRIVR